MAIRLKKYMCLMSLCILAFVIVAANADTPAKELKYIAKIEGRDFLIESNGEWKKTFLNGVNIGAAKPGTFPGELAITKAEYLRWFKYIRDMNADVIRVYTTMKPAFYDALYEFNRSSKKPLYLMQGVWINENDIGRLNDAYAENGKIKTNFIEDGKNLVDIIHGKAKLPIRQGFASGIYKSDVSPYVIGWIYGIEWDPSFVVGTNKNNPEKISYSGTYLKVDSGSAFEIFLAESGDSISIYEANTYRMARPVSFTNWLTTDPLAHINEPYHNEDLVSVDTEHIKATESFSPGMFASYHVYPYYPEFINYQKEYASFKDDSGRINTYRAYLKELFAHHTTPVLVAEFGIPASRGLTHESVPSGFNQGFTDEQQQGNLIVSLLKDIHAEGYFGALVFAWQDEWFKRTWNTMDLDLSDMRPFWSNAQTCEQAFGLMAFDPGKTQSVCNVDGDLADWKNIKPLNTNSALKLYVNSDEKYVYIMAQVKGFDSKKDTLYIPVDTLKNQGNSKSVNSKLTFQKPTEFLIQIKGTGESKILVDASYDAFYYQYGEQLKMIPTHPEYHSKDSGLFNPMYQCLSREMILPEDQRIIPFTKHETGKLTFGDANPTHKAYNSLADFYIKGETVEIRIPWQLLNVMDPSTKSIMGNLYKNKGFKAEKVSEFNMGASIVKLNQSKIPTINMDSYAWKTWTLPTYHERLKPSYFILKDYMSTLK